VEGVVVYKTYPTPFENVDRTTIMYQAIRRHGIGMGIVGEKGGAYWGMGKLYSTAL
jgi:hypothetical protein